MFKLSVAQKPTTAVIIGRNTLRNCPSFGPPATNALGVDNIAPSPPAAAYAQTKRDTQSTINTGAAYFSTTRMDSIPLTTTATCAAQNVA